MTCSSGQGAVRAVGWSIRHHHRTGGGALGLTSDHPHVPTDEELAQAMALMGLEDLVLDEEACTAYLTRPGMAIDLGGIAKGWTADQLREYARELGAERGYVSLGGNLMIIGERPDGDPFKFGAAGPAGRCQHLPWHCNAGGRLHYGDHRRI